MIKIKNIAILGLLLLLVKAGLLLIKEGPLLLLGPFNSILVTLQRAKGEHEKWLPIDFSAFYQIHLENVV